MGQAKQRGDFEKRKAEAIERAGKEEALREEARAKRAKEKPRMPKGGPWIPYLSGMFPNMRRFFR